MLRTIVARCVVALPVVSAACAGSRQARLDAHGLALGSVPGVRVGTEPREAAATRAVEASVKPLDTVVADYALETRLRRELADKQQVGGAAALEVIEPGTSTESRLRFALSRMLLARGPEATAALNALTSDAPNCALAWLWLGQVRSAAGDAAAAVTCLRRSLVVEREVGRTSHPALRFELARNLLQTEELDEGLRLLREEIAGGSRRVAAAELVAQVEGESGEFESALAALDAVLDEVPDEPTLVVVKAVLLGDQLRFDEAANLLQQRGQRIDRATLVQQRALLQRQRGDVQGALALLTEAIDQASAAPSDTTSATVQAVRAELEADRQARTRRDVRVREILGRVRFARQPIERVDAVRLLCKNAPAAVQAAVRWGLRDPNEAVRIAAITSGLPHCDNAIDLLQTGLQDKASLVRAAAATAASTRPPSRAASRPLLALLVDSIAQEAEPDAFRAMHRALIALSGRDLAMPFDGERTPAVRARLAQEWRQELERSAKESAGS